MAGDSDVCLDIRTLSKIRLAHWMGILAGIAADVVAVAQRRRVA